MPSLLRLTVAAFACATAASASVLSLAMSRSVSQGTSYSKRSLSKRNTFNGDLINNATAGQYNVNVTVGTPPQQMQLQIDTGSSDVWVLGAEIYSDPDQCSGCFGGAFNRNKSSSYVRSQQNTNLLSLTQAMSDCHVQLSRRANSSLRFVDVDPDDFSISYADGSGVDGDYFTDNLGFNGQTIKNLTMGVALDAYAGTTTGVMGVGFTSNEANYSAGGALYPSIIDQMVSENIIGSHSYSLWLDDLEASTGTVLFGGYVYSRILFDSTSKRSSNIRLFNLT